MVLVLRDVAASRGRRCRAGADRPASCSAPPIRRGTRRWRSPGFVAVGHQHERRVVAVGLQDPVGFGVDPLVDRLAVADRRPGGALDLIVEAQFVGRDERRLGRAPGMEADLVQSVRLAIRMIRFHDSHIGRRIAGQREDAAFQRAAEEGLLSVHRELRALGGELAEAEGGVRGVGVMPPRSWLPTWIRPDRFRD